MSNEAKHCFPPAERGELQGPAGDGLASELTEPESEDEHRKPAGCPLRSTDCVPPRPRRAPVAAPTAGASVAEQGQNHPQNHKQDHKRGNQKEELTTAGLDNKEL